MGTSLREVTSACLNNWRTVMMTRNGFFVSRKYDNIEIYDRVGGGDSFASALIWGFLRAIRSRRSLILQQLTPRCATPSAMTGIWSPRRRPTM